MGYRERLVRVPKSLEGFRDISDYETLVTQLKLEEDDSFTGFDNAPELLYLHTTLPNDSEHVTEFFKHFSIKAASEHRFQIISKDGLKALMDVYYDEIVEMMDKKLIETRECPELLVSDLDTERQYWKSDYFESLKPYQIEDEKRKLEEKDGQITSLPYMKYQIFNVVFIYNTFDWDNNYLVISGW